MNDDLISRQAALKAICEDGTWLESQGCTEITMAERKQRDADILSDLPSAQPEHRFDEWCTDCKEYDHERHCCPRFNAVIRRTIEDLEADRKKGRWLPDNIVDESYWVCSCCKFPSEAFAANVLYNFCPNCGARMEEE